MRSPTFSPSVTMRSSTLLSAATTYPRLVPAAVRIDPHDSRDLGPSRDVVAAADQAFGHDPGKRSADDRIGRRLARQLDAGARRLERAERLLRDVLRELKLLSRGLDLGQLLLV